MSGTLVQIKKSADGQWTSVKSSVTAKMPQSAPAKPKTFSVLDLARKRSKANAAEEDEWLDGRPKRSKFDDWEEESDEEWSEDKPKNKSNVAGASTAKTMPGDRNGGKGKGTSIANVKGGKVNPNQSFSGTVIKREPSSGDLIIDCVAANHAFGQPAIISEDENFMGAKVGSIICFKVEPDRSGVPRAKNIVINGFEQQGGEEFEGEDEFEIEEEEWPELNDRSYESSNARKGKGNTQKGAHTVATGLFCKGKNKGGKAKGRKV